MSSSRLRETSSTHNRLRHAARDESGFTLLELLVVCLIIGVLAAIAIPSFLSQKSKADDATAKVQVRTMETAAESSATDASGKYSEITTARLEEIEPTLKDHTTDVPKVDSATASTYEVQSTNNVTGDVLKITRNANGEVTRTCTSPVSKTGCSGGETGSW